MQSVSQRKNATLVIDLTSLAIKDNLLCKRIRSLRCMYRSQSAPPEETMAMMGPMTRVMMTTSSFQKIPHTSNLLFH